MLQNQDMCTLTYLPKKAKAAAVAVQKALCLCTPWHWPKLTLKLCALHHNPHWSVRLQQSAMKYVFSSPKCQTPQLRHKSQVWWLIDWQHISRSEHTSEPYNHMLSDCNGLLVLLKKLSTWKADLGSASCSICSSSCASVTQEYNKLPSC